MSLLGKLERFAKSEIAKTFALPAAVAFLGICLICSAALSRYVPGGHPAAVVDGATGRICYRGCDVVEAENDSTAERTEASPDDAFRLGQGTPVPEESDAPTGEFDWSLGESVDEAELQGISSVDASGTGSSSAEGKSTHEAEMRAAKQLTVLTPAISVAIGLLLSAIAGRFATGSAVARAALTAAAAIVSFVISATAIFSLLDPIVRNPKTMAEALVICSACAYFVVWNGKGSKKSVDG